ncbi:MAG TPA: P-II family nitrogen regulator [Planctomycetota bacterium]|nr:P-II family nitrogen regulator [Planctomycetota bacterium]
MYWIICIIRATSLRAVREKLNDIGCLGMTVSECEGYGRQKGHKEVYRGAEYSFQLVPKVRLEIACTQGELNLALQAITEAGRTGPEGSIGDGKIFVLPLEDAVRIRTGESGKQVL